MGISGSAGSSGNLGFSPTATRWVDEQQPVFVWRVWGGVFGVDKNQTNYHRFDCFGYFWIVFVWYGS